MLGFAKVSTGNKLQMLQGIHILQCTESHFSQCVHGAKTEKLAFKEYNLITEKSTYVVHLTLLVQEEASLHLICQVLFTSLTSFDFHHNLMG